MRKSRRSQSIIENNETGKQTFRDSPSRKIDDKAKKVIRVDIQNVDEPSSPEFDIFEQKEYSGYVGHYFKQYYGQLKAQLEQRKNEGNWVLLITL